MSWIIRTDALVTAFLLSMISESWIARQLSSVSMDPWANGK